MVVFLVFWGVSGTFDTSHAYLAVRAVTSGMPAGRDARTAHASFQIRFRARHRHAL